MTQAALAALLVGALARCGGGGQDCEPGRETCECLKTQCFDGLACLGGMCVAVPGLSTSQPSGDPETTTPTTAGPGETTAPVDSTTSTTSTTSTPVTTIPDATDTGGTLTSGDATTGTVTASTTAATTSTTAVDTSTDTGDLTITAAPPVCGDGHVDPGEACDDGNDDDADACDNDCTWNAPLIIYVDPVTKGLYGGEEGAAFDAACDGVVASIVGDQDAYKMLAIGGTCKRMTLVPAGPGYAVKFTPSADLPWHGTKNGNTHTSPCDPSAVPVGYTIYTDNQWVEGVRTSCAPVSLVDGELVLGAPSSSPVIGGGDQVAVFAKCPAGYVVTGHYGFAAERVYGLGFHCAKPVAILE